MSNSTTFALVILIALLASLGVMTNSIPVMTLAASTLTGLFALLQGHPPK